MSALYPEVPACIRISDAPTTHGNPSGGETATERKKRCFPWTYKLLKALAAARAAGATWPAITDQLIDKTGRQISPDAVANRVLRFEEEEEEK
jgi:hypothetical protein